MQSVTVTVLEAVAGRDLPEPGSAEQVRHGQPWPLAAYRHGDIAAILLLRRRNAEELAISVEVLQLRAGSWEPLAQAQDEWDRNPSGEREVPQAPIAPLAWVASERADGGTASAIWGTAEHPITQIAVAHLEAGPTVTVTPLWRAFIVVTRSPGPGWFQRGSRSVTLRGLAGDGRVVAEETVQAY